MVVFVHIPVFLTPHGVFYSVPGLIKFHFWGPGEMQTLVQGPSKQLFSRWKTERPSEAQPMGVREKSVAQPILRSWVFARRGKSFVAHLQRTPIGPGCLVYHSTRTNWLPHCQEQRYLSLEPACTTCILSTVTPISEIWLLKERRSGRTLLVTYLVEWLRLWTSMDSCLLLSWSSLFFGSLSMHCSGKKFFNCKTAYPWL